MVPLPLPLRSDPSAFPSAVFRQLTFEEFQSLFSAEEDEESPNGREREKNSG